MVKIKEIKQEPDFIKFLGTAGARFVMIKQLRASGGIWIRSQGNNLLVDPGPGSIVRCASSRPKLDPSKLDAIILTHKHLDHSNDINVMIEAMTEGGFKKRGVVFCPRDAIGDDPVIFNYSRVLPERIEVLEAGKAYKLKTSEPWKKLNEANNGFSAGFTFRASMRHMHPAETYGLKFKMRGTSVSLLADTKYFDKLNAFYRTDLLIINVVFLEPRPGIEHLSLSDAERLIRQLKPKKAILTHFGMTMVMANPGLQAQLLSQKLGIEVLAAYDGMALSF